MLRKVRPLVNQMSINSQSPRTNYMEETSRRWNQIRYNWFSFTNLHDNELNFKANRPLPPEFQVPKIGVHYYLYGLTFFKDDYLKRGRRSRIFNPFFILWMEFLYLLRSILMLYVDENDPQNRSIFVQAGDYPYFIRAKNHINISASQYMLAGLTTLLLNLYRFYRNCGPKFLKSLEFLSGNNTPTRCGMNNCSYIHKLSILSKSILKLANSNTRLVIIASFILSLVPLAMSCNASEIIHYGIPWSIIFAISSYFTFSSNFWNMAYFFIVCHYMKFRIREVADSGKKGFHNLEYLIRRKRLWWNHSQYVSIANQVIAFNGNYWASVLFIIVLFLSTFNNVVLYTALYSTSLSITIRIILFYANLNSIMAIYFLLNTASIVHFESHQCRLTYASMYASNVRDSNTIRFRSLYKLHSMIDLMSYKPIGFWFTKLFMINYFKFFEVFFLLIAFIIMYFNLLILFGCTVGFNDFGIIHQNN